MDQSMINEFNTIIDNNNIYSVYQPIVSLRNGEILAYEALMRGPESSRLQSPIALLEVAKAENRLFELEMMSRKKAILGASSMAKNCLLFLNIESDIMKDGQYKMGYTKDLLGRSDLTEHNIVFEITERAAISDYEQYIELIENYKHQGYRIAIDDVGSEYSGLNRIHRTKPQFIKIDMEYVRDIHKDSFKQSLVAALAQFATMANMKSIAEGIETKEELESIMSLGIDYGQGYYIGRPSKIIQSNLNEISATILEILSKIDRFSDYDINTYKIGTIADTSEAFTQNKSCKKIKDSLNIGNLEGIAIVNEQQEPIGLVMKSMLESKMATQYGYSLYVNRPIHLIMDHYPTVVNYDTPLKRVSEIVTLRQNSQVYDNIIVEKNGKYYGIVSIRNLLQQITSVETDYARHLNPLTLLPGNRSINHALLKFIGVERKLAFGYLDLDNFKVYNDNYGFENGDKILITTAHLIEKHVQQHFKVGSFIGHIGGDDFVIIITENLDQIEAMLRNLLLDFERSIQDFFSADDIKNQKIIGYDRNKELKVFDLTALSIAVYLGSLHKFSTVEVFSEYMGNLKKQAKKVHGNSYIIVDEMNLLIREYTTLSD